MAPHRKAPCDGDCIACPYEVCIDTEQYWKYVKPDERQILLGPPGPERELVARRVYQRRRYHVDAVYRQRQLAYNKVYSSEAREWKRKRKQKAAHGGDDSKRRQR